MALFGKEQPPAKEMPMPKPQLPRVTQLPEAPTAPRRSWHPQALQFGQQIADMEDRCEQLRQERDGYERRALLAEETIEHLRQRMDEERMEHRSSLANLRAQNEQLRDMHAILKTKIEAGAKIFLGCLEHTPADMPAELPAPQSVEQIIDNLEREIAKPVHEHEHAPRFE